MASATEIFRVVGKVVLEGQDAIEKGLDSVISKAGKVDSSFKSSLGGLSNHVPKNVTKPIDDSLDRTGKEAEKAQGKIGGFFRSITEGIGLGIGAKLFESVGGIFSKIIDLGKGAGVDMNATLEKTTLQFETLTGSADKAKQIVNDLFDFAKSTPFETGPVIQASKMMQTFGGDALNTKKNLILVGDAAAATGSPIEEVGTWVGRLYAALQAGQPFGEAAQRLQELAIMSPKARLEMEAMQKAGKSADEIFTYFQQDMGKFTGAMEKQAGTWEGLTSTLSDTLNLAAATALKPFFDMAKSGLDNLIKLLSNPDFAKKAQEIGQNVATFVGNAVTTLVGWIKSAWPTVRAIFVSVRDSVITFVQALQGKWTSNENIQGIHQFFGNLGLIVRDVVIPAIQKFIGFLREVIPHIIEFAKQAINTFQTQVLPVIQNFIAAVWPKLQQFAQWFTGTIIPAAKQFASDMINTWTNTIQPAITNAINTILPLVQQFADWFITNAWPKIQEFTTNLMNAWKEIEPEVVGAIQSIVANIQSFLGPIVAFIQEHGDQIKAILTGTWNTIVAVLGPILDGIKQTILLVLNLIQGDWSGAWNNIKQLFIDILNSMYQMAKPLIDPLIQSFQNFCTMVGQFFSDLGTKTNEIWTAISTAIQTAWNAVVAFITPAINTFKEIWDGVWNAISIAWDTLWRVIATVVQVQWAILKAFIEPALTALQTLWNTVWDAVSQKVSDVWNFINDNIIQPVWGKIHDFLTTAWNTLKDAWSTMWDAVSSKATDIWNGIKDFVTNTWNTISSTATTVWKTIQDAVEGPINAAKTTLEGVWNDISTKATSTWDSIKTAISNAGQAIKDALMWPFNQFRDSVGQVTTDAGNKMLSPLQRAIDGFGDFVNGVKGAINWVSQKLQLGDIIQGTWSGAKIRTLASGTQNFSGGLAVIGEKGAELAKLPDGSVNLFTSPQLTNLPKGTRVYNHQDTLGILGGTIQHGIFGISQTGYGGFFDTLAGNVKKLTGNALAYGRQVVSAGAQKLADEAMAKVAIASFPGVMSGFGQAAAGLVKNSVVEAFKKLVQIVKDNIAPETSIVSDPSTWGLPGLINGVKGDVIMRVAQITDGVKGYCEGYVARVMAGAGVRYRQGVYDALEHYRMQPTQKGTGPLGAPVYFPVGANGDVAISMGNGMVYGTEGVSGPVGTHGHGPFAPRSQPYFTVNPAANGLVVDRPTAILAGENIPSQREIITPEKLMSQIVRGELQRSGTFGMPVNIYVTANTAAEGYIAGQAAAKGFRDKMRSSGWNN